MSFVLAVNCRVRDFDAWWAMIAGLSSDLIDLDARHVLIFRSTDDQDRVFATIGFHETASVQTIVRSPTLLSWFDLAGVEDVPPIFAGHLVERIDLREEAEQQPVHPSFLVASFVALDDVERLRSHARSELARMHSAGVRRYVIYQAFDDAQEVLIMRDIATEPQARQWLSTPEQGSAVGAARFMVYPPPFVGSLVRDVDVPRTTS